ncbi:MAG: PrgI family protein [Chloroflexi bacterium]|uniref:PrgI family protein n=1 Tax=Candidatus Chlorohelix allophototropha TaxID=3003348 RepID=A0A8T7M4T5_9CHLR|nr:PrgI family protein [Chloroflexota bacterium]WJW70266.1 PrgI family protein [Chloroflexota bacterium L227-S17]
MTLTHEIPTHLEVEDRPFFGLTFKQFTVLALGLGGLAFLYNYGLCWVPDPFRLILTVVAGAVALAITLLKLEGLSLLDWLMERVLFGFQPHQAIFGLYELQQGSVKEERSFRR